MITSQVDKTYFFFGEEAEEGTVGEYPIGSLVILRFIDFMNGMRDATNGGIESILNVVFSPGWGSTYIASKGGYWAIC